MTNNNIEKVVTEGLCAGCGTCVSICPLNALEMAENKKMGLYEPKVKGECNECGLCLKVCPGYEVDFSRLNQMTFGREPEDPYLGNYFCCYSGYATDSELRFNSSSGGIVTALLLYARERSIIDGALVAKMDEENPLKPKAFIAKTEEQIISAIGSKYCPVPANVAAKSIINENGRYAIVGLPCHIQGLRKAEMINEKLKKRIRLHVGLFCKGSPSFLATEFLLKMSGINLKEVRRIRYRGGGWPGRMSIEMKTGGTLFVPFPKYYPENHFSSYFRPSRCKLCIDGVNGFADISCGDAWLPEFKNDRIGTSIVIARDENADRFLHAAEKMGWIRIEPIDPEKVITSQKLSLKKNENRAFFYFMRSLGKALPSYNPAIVPKTTSTDFFRNFFLYLGSLLAFNRDLYTLFYVYSALTRLTKSLSYRLNFQI